MASEKTIYEVLAEEHRHTSDALERLELSRDPAERDRFFGELRALLEAHTDCETAVFYAALFAYEELEDQVDEAEREHDEVAQLLVAMEGLKGDRAGWKRQVVALRELVDGHILREEEVLFPAAQDLLQEDEAFELAQRYLEQKREYLG